MPRNGWEGGTYNNNNDHNVLVLCTMACKPRISARIWRPCLSSLQLWVEGGAGYELQGNHREQTLTVEAVVLDKHHNNDQRINVQGDDALMVIRIIPPEAFC